jgi:hypothetical protein
MARFGMGDLFRGPTPQERIDALHLRPDLGRAAVALVADQRVDVQLTRLNPLLEPDETVLMLVEGRHARHLGLLVLSTRRALFRPHGETSPGLPPPRAFALDDLLDADFRTGPMTGRVALRFPEAVLDVDRVLGTLAEQFVAAVNGARAAADRRQLRDAATPRDALQELVELRTRFAAGEVSSAEYEATKARLIREL